MIHWENYDVVLIFSHEAVYDLEVFTGHRITFIHHSVIAEDCVQDLNIFFGWDILAVQLSGQINRLLKDDPAVICPSDPCILMVWRNTVITRYFLWRNWLEGLHDHRSRKAPRPCLPRLHPGRVVFPGRIGRCCGRPGWAGAAVGYVVRTGAWPNDNV